jgi:O-antigen/teichoic acid export membrane protein
MSLSLKSFSIFKRDILLLSTNLATGILVARTLGPSVLGIWMILTLVPSYAEAFGRLKVDVASVYFIGQNKFHPQNILLSLNVIAIISSSLLLSLLLWQFELLYTLLFNNSESEFSSFLLVLFLQIPLQFLSLNYSYFHIACENILVYNRITIIQAWSYSIIVFSLLLFTDLKLWSIIIAVIVSITMGLVYGWYKVDRTSWSNASWSNSLSWEMIKYGLNFYLAGILGSLQKMGVRAITLSFLAPAQIAFLGQAQNFGLIFNKIPDALNTVLYPKASRSESANAAKVTCQAFRMSFIILVAGGATLGLIAESLITLLYGSSFQTTAYVIQLILPGIVINGASSTLISFFNGTGRAKLIPRMQLFPVIIQLITAFLLTRIWGITGAAIAISIGLSVYGLVLIIVFLKVSHTPVGRMIPNDSDFKKLLHFCRQILLSLLSKLENYFIRE